MIFDILNILGLAVIGLLWWKQQERLEDAEMMIGYALTLIESLEGDKEGKEEA